VSYLGDYAVAGYQAADGTTNYYELLATGDDSVNTFTTTAPTDTTGNLYAKETVHFSAGAGDTYAPDPAGTYIKTSVSGAYMTEAAYAALDESGKTEAGTPVTAVAVLEKTLTSSTVVGDDAEKQTNIVGVTNENGQLTFSGLPAGSYTITELEAPAGYNLLSDSIQVSITFTPDATSQDSIWSYSTTSSSDLTKLSDNTVMLTVLNVAGSTLPSTGGIGTTLFYVVGSCLVIGAAVVLISKKRMTDAGF
jgi:LPXTG-motif cell wall-anchored protein